MNIKCVATINIGLEIPDGADKEAYIKAFYDQTEYSFSDISVGGRDVRVDFIVWEEFKEVINNE